MEHCATSKERARKVRNPPSRLYGRREGVLEIWQPTNSLGDAIDSMAEDSLEECRAKGWWDEDQISAVLLNGLCELAGPISTPDGGVLDVSFSGYKLKGKKEYSRGDIAFVVGRRCERHEFWGVGYMEVKKRDTGTKKFESFREEQLSRILLSEPYAVLGMYDFDPEFYNEAPIVRHADSRVAVLPMRQVANGMKHIDELCRYSTTLGHQISMRYANGADLNLCANLADAVIRASKAEYLMTIGYGTPLQLDHPDVTRILKQYATIEDVLDQILHEGIEPPRGPGISL